MEDNYGGFARGEEGQAAAAATADTLKTKVTAEARKLANKAGSEARTRFDDGKREAASTLNSVAQSLQQSGTQLLDDRQNVAGDYIQRAAGQVDRLARYMENKNVDEIVDDVEHFARKRPAVFLGAAFVVGIVAARFLKSSRAGRHQPYENLADREVPRPYATEAAPVDSQPWSSASTSPQAQWMGEGDEA